MLAVVYVDTVIIPIATIHNRHAINDNIGGSMERHSPTCTVPQGDAMDVDAVTFSQEEELWTSGRTHSPIIVVRIDAFANMMQTVDGQGKIQTLGIHRATTDNTDVLRRIADDETRMNILIASTTYGIAASIIIVRIGATKQSGFRIKVDFHIAFQP